MAILDSTKTALPKDYPDEYPKIQTLYHRDPNIHKVIPGAFSRPEFDYLRECQWDVHEKIDGTNIRVHWNGETVKFYGRTSRAQIPCSLLAALTELFPPEKFASYPDPICLYGEGYGAGIQKGGGNYLSSSNSFALFDVRCGGFWLRRDDVEDVATVLGINEAPFLGRFTLLDGTFFGNTVKRFESVIAESSGFLAEGIVARPSQQLFTRDGKRIIAKLKMKDFLTTEDRG